MVVCTWLWGSKYSLEDVAKLFRGFDRNVQQEMRFLLVADRRSAEVEAAVPTWGVGRPVDFLFQDDEMMRAKGCFSRLSMFDPGWQMWANLLSKQEKVDRLVCSDLDVVVTGSCDPLFNRPENFVILGAANSANPCPFNGSLMMIRVGVEFDVLEDFDFDREVMWNLSAFPDKERPYYYEFADDQGWIANKMPNAATWKAGHQSGVYAFKKPGWPPGDDLPSDARAVVFPGSRSPSQFTHLPWVQEHWR